MNKPFSTGLVWFRRDLRVDDNAALHHALKNCQKVQCVFVFDTNILNELPRKDRRVAFIQESLVALDLGLRQAALAAGVDAQLAANVGLIVLHGSPLKEIAHLAKHLEAQAVFANHDDEPAALARDAQVRGALANAGIALHTYKDHVVFERQEVLTLAGNPYTVFTPYKNAWLKKVQAQDLAPHPVAELAAALAPRPKAYQKPVPTLPDIDFEVVDLAALHYKTGVSGAQALLEDFLHRIDRYEETRNFPAVKGPSYLSVHLRFGTVSIRQLASEAWQRYKTSEGASVWLSELIWRDFYAQILANFPHVAERSFKSEYDAIHWDHGPHGKALFAAWCEGRTGYPLVDAAMAQINQTGYMHNRLRMVVASFLTKDLGVDWRWGEKYFAQHLIDFDLSANNGGWQWASSSGCDAQPYFRIFNPVTQSEKFDPQGKFIKRYLPQLAGLEGADIHAPWDAKPLALQAAGVTLGKDYPMPVVNHAEARETTLARYAVVKKTA
jgi:deoxyribodipyrimidine photo-lyase